MSIKNDKTKAERQIAWKKIEQQCSGNLWLLTPSDSDEPAPYDEEEDEEAGGHTDVHVDRILYLFRALSSCNNRNNNHYNDHYC